MGPELERILLSVQKPARYTGGEYNQIVKDKAAVEVRVALCFPDVYEIAMSNLGLRILYGAINQMDGVWCERAFEPWGDMRAEMKRAGLPLWALESGDPVRSFDMLGFSVGYEMSYIGLLNMLDLAGIPLYAQERTELAPIVFAGGTCMYNCEPLAPFLDLAVIGEGEEADCELIELYRKAKREGWTKQAFLRAAAQIEGVYVPSLYRPAYDEDGRLASITPEEGAPARVRKRIIQNLDKVYFPTKTIVPSTEIVHDRAVLELFRGCIRGCRFCQAGFVYRPVRAKRCETLVRQGCEALADSGYQEINLSSLSTSDYRELTALCDGLLDYCEPHMTNLSLPSLRADNFSMELMKRLQKVRKSGLTFAPEAGSQRLRDVINKNVTEEELLTSCRTAFEGGWSSVKLYFMLGLPTETDEDVLAIADLAYKVLDTWKKYAPRGGKFVKITVSTSCFVPKPMTPFQWEGQVSREEFQRREQMLKDALRSRAISYSWHTPEVSFVEAVLAKGDRRLAPVLESVWRKTGGLNAWEEYFSFEAWMEAFAEQGIDPAFYANREMDEDELLPWSVIDTGVETQYLRHERAQAYRGEITPDCRVRCSGGGARRLSEEGECDA